MAEGRKADGGKPASYLLAHDVIRVDNDEDNVAPHEMTDLATILRQWWNRAGVLPPLWVSREDYFGVVKILEFGAKKYAPRNWENGIAFSRVFRAAMDHYARMPYDDEETGLPHRWHFLCCYMFLAAYVARGFHQCDDRPGVGPFIVLEQAPPTGEARIFHDAVARECGMCESLGIRGTHEQRLIEHRKEAGGGA